MMKRKSFRAQSLIIAAAMLALAVGPGVAQGQDDRAEGAIFLLLPVGAQGVSLGRAMSWVEGAESAFWNPAGLAGVTESQGILFRGEHPAAGAATAATVVWAAEGTGALGASYYLLDAGEIDKTDEFGNYTGTITIRNHVGVISAATRLGDAIAAGLNFKVIRFQLGCRGICEDEGTTATTYAVDAGIQSMIDNLRVGAMLAHLGPGLQVLNAEQTDPLPSRIRIAAAYEVVSSITENEALSAWLAFEIEDRVYSLGNLSYYLGMEVAAGNVDRLSLRTGYVWSDLQQEDGGRVGLGLRFERFDLSIAKSLAVSSLTGETEPVHVTFAIRF
jgi:hypothetical protein